MDWQDSKIAYRKNIDIILGYNKDEFTLELSLKLAHPDDIYIVERFTQTSVNYLINADSAKDLSLNISYRLRKKCGNYIKVLRQTTIFERSDNGIMNSNI